MARFILRLMELGVSAAVHLAFGFYVFSTAVAADISQAAAASGSFLLRRPPAPPAAEGALVDVAAAGERDERAGAAPVVLDGSPPPIVLVHGIFGFGKGVWNRTQTLLTSGCSSVFFFRRSGGGGCSVKCFGGRLLMRFPPFCLLPRAEARRALLLRRRREEGRPRARAGFGVAHQHP